eukprot:4224129-Pyramimonas_sp.AAC.1
MGTSRGFGAQTGGGSVASDPTVAGGPHSRCGNNQRCPCERHHVVARRPTATSFRCIRNSGGGRGANKLETERHFCAQRIPLRISRRFKEWVACYVRWFLNAKGTEVGESGELDTG